MIHSENYNKYNQIIVIENDSDFWIGDILTNYNVKIIYGFHNISDNHVPPEQLIVLNSSNPLIRNPLNYNYEPMTLVLEKVGVRFTDLGKAGQLKPCILDWNPQNVLQIVEILRKFKDVSMENFLEPLDSKDRESFRKFINDYWMEFVYEEGEGKFF